MLADIWVTRCNSMMISGNRGAPHMVFQGVGYYALSPPFGKLHDDYCVKEGKIAKIHKRKQQLE